MADTFWGKIHEVRKCLWAFFSIVLFGCCLAGQAVNIKEQSFTMRSLVSFCDFASRVHFTIILKPWPNGLASGRKFWTCVSFGHPLASTCIDLRQLATTCVDLRGLWSSSNLDASRRKLFTVWPPSASRHKLIASNLLL